MRTPSVWLLALWVLGVVPGLAQTQAPIESPEIRPDRSVIFRLRAPAGQHVQLQCEGIGLTNLQKNGNGVWSFTTPPLQPDIYVYSFIVDGLRITDPNNFSLKYNLITDESLLHVPGDASLLWEVSDVPHGDLHRHYYHSAVSGDYRDYIVYTPPGYNPSAWKKYPVLYLLHGYSDDTTTWSAVGCANVILDNLIARHLAKPMIVVMPLGYGDMNVVKGGWGGLRVRGLLEGSMSKFQEGLLKEIVPQVEKDYRASGDRNNRAIAGVSMGATESLLTGLNRPDQFAWIGSFSAGGLETNYPAEFPAAGTNLNSQLRLFWLSCGDRDSLFPLNRGFNDWLASRGVSAKWVDVSGEHSFRLWRRNLADFTPLLFLKTK